MTDFFPFHAIGFQCNPFRALTDEEWAAVTVLPVDLQGALGQGFDHLQILGPLGYGKTTRLLALRAGLREAGHSAAYEYIPEGQSSFVTGPGTLDYFLLDEAQRLGRRERGRLVSLPHLHLILSSHEDLSPLFAGRRLKLTTVRIHNDENQLRAVLERRLSYFARDSPPAITLDSSALAFLHRTFGGNMRAAQHFLYEVFQRFPPPGAITGVQLEKDPALTLARPDHLPL